MPTCTKKQTGVEREGSRYMGKFRGKGDFLSFLHITHPCKINFSLIELLVVIAILAILLAILLPALNKAREKGEAIGCVNNLKQLTLSFHAYGNDFDGFSPWNCPNSTGDSMSWKTRLYKLKYINTYQHTRCPVKPFSVSSLNWTDDNRGTGYGFSNGWWLTGHSSIDFKKVGTSTTGAVRFQRVPLLLQCFPILSRS